jgi:hypothetical protein
VPMTQEEFYPAFERLNLAFNRFAFLSDRERAIFTEDWYQEFKHYLPDVWEQGVAHWKSSRRSYPTMAELHDVLQEDVAPRLVFEREERERQERLAARPPIDQVRRAELQERMRRLKAAMQLKPPAPSDAPPLLGDAQR